MGFHQTLKAQFGRPTGVLGHLAGWAMAHTGPNRRRSLLTLDLLELRPGQRVLELGFGPGVALGEIAKRVGPSGFVAGVDPSQVMLSQAARRNAELVEGGRMDLRLGEAASLPSFTRPFDVVLAVNSYHHWQDADEGLRRVHDALAVNGTVAITEQPRGAAANERAAEAGGEAIASSLRSLGFVSVTVSVLDLKPVPGVCVTGRRSS